MWCRRSSLTGAKRRHCANDCQPTFLVTLHVGDAVDGFSNRRQASFGGSSATAFEVDLLADNWGHPSKEKQCVSNRCCSLPHSRCCSLPERPWRHPARDSLTFRTRIFAIPTYALQLSGLRIGKSPSVAGERCTARTSPLTRWDDGALHGSLGHRVDTVVRGHRGKWGTKWTWMSRRSAASPPSITSPISRVPQ